jgi:hypothetical protein
MNMGNKIEIKNIILNNSKEVNDKLLFTCIVEFNTK